jgi:RNA polymerase sigma-70 factor (ECF subfamily)
MNNLHDASPDQSATFNQHRATLLGVAYRMLGQVSDAEDVVQDAWLRWSDIDATHVRDPRAFLISVTTRLAIDRLRRAKTRREVYVGSWLPEPVATERDVADDVELAESISMAMLVLLERLSPLERAVFVLHEAFAMSHAEIAEILQRSEPSVRQLLKRARDHIGQRQVRYGPDPAVQQQITERFLAACIAGDLTGLLALLAPDAALIADSGGKATAPIRSIVGADRIARFLLGITGKFPADIRIELMHLNGALAIVGFSGGVPIGVIQLALGDHAVHTVHLVANPDKLTGLMLTSIR